MRQFAKEKLKHWLRVLFHTQDSAERTALAFAVGVFIAFLPPVFWLHTLLALAIAFLFRLNRLAVLAGTYTNTPITIIPLMWVEIRVGQLLLPGYRNLKLRDLKLPKHPTSFEGWWHAFVQLKPFVPPFILGSLLLGLLGAGIAYVIALRVIVIYRQKRAAAEAAERAAADGDRSEGSGAALSVPAGPAVDTPENPS